MFGPSMYEQAMTEAELERLYTVIAVKLLVKDFGPWLTDINIGEPRCIVMLRMVYSVLHELRERNPQMRRPHVDILPHEKGGPSLILTWQAPSKVYMEFDRYAQLWVYPESPKTTGSIPMCSPTASLQLGQAGDLFNEENLGKLRKFASDIASRL